MMDPFFAVVEGIDRVGKSTFIKKLHTDLNKLQNARLLRDPDPQFKPALMSTEDLKSQLAIFSMSRTLTTQENKNFSGILLSDRWTPSTAFYQQVECDKLIQLSDIFGWLRPDVIYLLSIDHDEWVARWMKRTDSIETTEKRFLPMLTDRAAYEDACAAYAENCERLVKTDPKSAVIKVSNYHDCWALFLSNTYKGFCDERARV